MAAIEYIYMYGYVMYSVYIEYILHMDETQQVFVCVCVYVCVCVCASVGCWDVQVF